MRRGLMLVSAVMVAASLTPFVSNCASGDDWPQWRGRERDGVWRETGIIDAFASTDVPLKWRVPVSGGRLVLPAGPTP